jgi:hypothetical protein
MIQRYLARRAYLDGEGVGKMTSGWGEYRNGDATKRATRTRRSVFSFRTGIPK